MGRKDKIIPAEGTTSAAQQLGMHMRQARQAKAVSLTAMAEQVGYTKSLLSSVENGRVKPTWQLLERYEQVLALATGTFTAVLSSEQISQRRRPHTAPLDMPASASAHALIQKDLGEAPALKHFYGRDNELAELRQWLQQDRCTLISIFGIGGIGKTTLASRLVDQVVTDVLQGDFEFVFWRSLQNAPSIESILKQAILFLSRGQLNTLPEEDDTRLFMLIKLLSEHRCLIVLDNFESILKSNNPAGQYRDEYTEYGNLIQRIGEGNHRSCLLLTSREKPGEIARLEGKTLPVRSLEVLGIEQLEVIENILKGEGLFGSIADWQRFIQRYSGNPLALKLISAYIRELFAGDIASFLAEGEASVGDVSELFAQQFQRLSTYERDVMYWLAIQYDLVALEDLTQMAAFTMPRIELISAIGSLRRRFMIEIPSAKNFTLQPVIREYIVNNFVAQVVEEIASGKQGLFASHALINAQAKDYVRRDQERYILQPVAERLVNRLGRDRLERTLTDLLALLRRERPLKPEYTAGNILNLLIYLNNGNLSGCDFSHLVIRQAYLQNITLHGINFARADIQAPFFTETFKCVFSIALSPDGKQFAMGTETGEIQLRDATNGALRLTFRAGEGSWVCWSVAFSPDGFMLASGSEDQLIRLWDIETGEVLNTLEGHTDWVKTVAFSPDGSILASGSYDQTVRLWDVATGTCFMVLDEHNDSVHSVTFSYNGSMLASCSDDQTIRLWNVDKKQSIRTLGGKDDHILAISFSPDDSILASGGHDNHIHLWDCETGEHLTTLKGHTAPILSLAFNRDGSMIASGSDDQTVRIWKVQTGENIRVLSGHSDEVWSVAFGTKDNILVSGSTDFTVRLWDIQQGNCLRELQGYTNAIRAIAFSPDGSMVVSGNESHLLCLWNLRQQPKTCKTLQGHTNIIRSIAFSPDGSKFVSGGDDKTLRLWDVQKGDCLNILQDHSTWVKSVAFSPDGKLLASGSAGQTIRLWDADTGKCMKVLAGHTSQVRAVAFSPDGKLLVSASDDKTVRIWEINAGRYTCCNILQGHEGHVWSVVFSPGGEILASGSDDQTIRIWETYTGRCIRTIEAKDTKWIGSLTFSPDGDILASGHGDKTARLWKAESGEEIGVLRGHVDVVYTVAFSPDGLLVASGGRDGLIKIWDAKTGEDLDTMQAERPYERTNIAGTIGLNDAQRAMLKALGAIEERELL